MPPDRAEASYLLYSRLMPVAESAGQGWPHALFLVQDKTAEMVPSDQPCHAEAGGSGAFERMTNPHSSVHPPESDREDFEQILVDFDHHCHERIQLDATSWKASAPVHILDEAGQSDYWSTHNATRQKGAVAEPSKYAGAPGIFIFSEAFFNTHHTVALIYAGVHCGSLCGQWLWYAFRFKDGQWLPLKWSSTVMMS